MQGIQELGQSLVYTQLSVRTTDEGTRRDHVEWRSTFVAQMVLYRLALCPAPVTEGT